MSSPTAGSPAKRMAPNEDNGPSKRHRSSRACLSCRGRKVRCDVAISNVPCTNCRLDNTECQLRDSNRGRKPSRRAAEQSVIVVSVPEVEPSRLPTPESASPVSQLPVSLTFEDQLMVPRTMEGVEGPGMGQQNSPDSINVDVGVSSVANASSIGSQTNRLPCYIRPLDPSLGPGDLEYLEQKDALTIPDMELRDELLKIYVRVVYPFMPAVELGDLLIPIVKADGNNPISLLLFQAVMFVAVAFIDMDHLRRRGFDCRRSARKRFFNRARVLHNLECEPDRLAKLQALLLMTYWYGGPDDEKDTWYWTGISLSLAQVLGLHRDHSGLALSKQAKRLRSRIWWSCFTRDRLMALGIRRPQRIRNDEFNTPLLTVDDLKFDPLPDDVISFLGPSIWLRDAKTCQTLAFISIELVKLCVQIGQILLTQYSVLGSHPVGSGNLTSFMVFPVKSGEQLKDLGKCDTALKDWYQNLDASCRYTPFSLPRSQLAEEKSMILYLHKASLHMAYLTTVGALHRPQAFHIDADSAEGLPRRTDSKQRVSDSAIGITELAYDLQLYNLLRYMSTTSVPALISAILIHLLDTRSTKEDVRNISIGRYYQCRQALDQLRDMYASADYALGFIETVIKNIGIKTPVLSFGIEPSTRTTVVPIANRPSVEASRSSVTVTDACLPQHQSLATMYPTPNSFTNSASQFLNNISGNRTTMEQLHPNVETLGSSASAHLSLSETSDHMSRNGSWTEVDSLLSAMMTFESGRNVYPWAMDTEQPWFENFM